MKKIIFKGDNGRAYIGTSETLTAEDKLVGLISVGETGAETEDIDVTDLGSDTRETENGYKELGTCEIEVFLDKEQFTRLKGYNNEDTDIYLGTFIIDKKTGEAIYSAGFKGKIGSIKAGAMGIGESARYTVSVKLNKEVELTEPVEEPAEG